MTNLVSTATIIPLVSLNLLLHRHHHQLLNTFNQKLFPPQPHHKRQQQHPRHFRIPNLNHPYHPSLLKEGEFDSKVSQGVRHLSNQPHSFTSSSNLLFGFQDRKGGSS
eukprot:PhF_6_TR7269/c0_g1_i1/m.10844